MVTFFISFFLKFLLILYKLLNKNVKRFIPESPRWLITNNRNSEAFKYFRKVAKHNKVDFNENEESNKLELMLSKEKVDDAPQSSKNSVCSK